MPEANPAARTLTIVGGGPAALIAAETARAAGLQVDVFEAKGSVGRKFLIAGKGGLNLTHSEPFDQFVRRFGGRQQEVAAWLRDFGADALREWAAGLGVDTFVGSSGRVFPQDLKAAPLLRGWVRRLREQGVRFHVQHRWTGWSETGELRFATPEGIRDVAADAVLLALGGGSWPQLGSDGAWQLVLAQQGVDVAPLQPSNCGFDIGWSEHFVKHHAGAPLKPVVVYWRNPMGLEQSLQGECVITETGIEGSLIYALSGTLRDAIAREGQVEIHLDLAPGRDLPRLQRDLAKPRGGRSLSEHLRREAGLTGARANLIYEVLGRHAQPDSTTLATTIKRLPLLLKRPRPLHESISSAGGIRLEALDEALMIKALPGVFAAGEMLDWEAPTGGYLLTACFASGHRAALGAVAWLTAPSATV
jgi:uncharacterized flavoprotein (TIGR03862 family)